MNMGIIRGIKVNPDISSETRISINMIRGSRMSMNLRRKIGMYIRGIRIGMEMIRGVKMSMI